MAGTIDSARVLIPLLITLIDPALLGYLSLKAEMEKSSRPPHYREEGPRLRDLSVEER